VIFYEQKKSSSIYLRYFDFFVRHSIWRDAVSVFFETAEPSEFRQKFFEKLKKELNLTNDQSLKIGFILDRRAQDFKNIKQKFRQDFAETHKQLRAEIEQELTPDQKEKFKIMVEKYERKIKNKD